MPVQDVLNLLLKFQDGYTHRDLSQLDVFMELFVPGDELEVIGTNAVEPGKDEWCLGRDATRELVAGDWAHWGNVDFDLKGAHINIKDAAAWIAMNGTVTDRILVEDRYDGYLDYIDSVLKDENRSPQMKTLDIVSAGNDIVMGLSLDDVYVWPFRLTAVAVRNGGVWRFHQIHFSFATTRAPDVRYT